MPMKRRLESRGNQKLCGTLLIFHLISVAPPHCMIVMDIKKRPSCRLQLRIATISRTLCYS